MPFDQDLYAWAHKRYLHLLDPTVADDLGLFERNQFLFHQLREQERRCSECTSPDQCSGLQTILDVEASRHYGGFILGSEPCPILAHDPIVKLAKMEKHGFSSVEIAKIASTLSSQLTNFQNYTNSDPSQGIVVNPLSNTPNQLTKLPEAPLSGKTEPNSIYIAGNSAISAFDSRTLSTIEAQGLGLEQLLRGGVIVLKYEQTVNFGRLSIQDSNSEAIPGVHSTPPKVGVEYVKAQGLKGLNTKGLNNIYGPRVRPRGGDLGLPLRIDSDSLVISPWVLPTQEAVAHWLGTAVALHGLVPGYFSVSSMGADMRRSIEDSSLARFLDFVEEIEVLVLVGWRSLKPGRPATTMILDAVQSFLSNDGVLWVVLDWEVERLDPRDQSEIPILALMASLPRYEAKLEQEA